MVYCIGAKDKGQAAAFRGATAKYLYIDEFPDISEEVFSIFSSRLSTAYSCADMTGNPKDPKHWSEEFIASDKDIYFQRYSLYDNPFLTKETIVIAVYIFVMIVQSNYFATKLDLSNLKNEMLQMKIELKKYADDGDRELLHNIDSKYQIILNKLDKFAK